MTLPYLPRAVIFDMDGLTALALRLGYTA